ncbi:MAG: DNA-processing protein DprA [Candidatus Alcyoniella australis]|nr:DNA-processing protein DprA [Candidatus Alcyoniella australis]
MAPIRWYHRASMETAEQHSDPAVSAALELRTLNAVALSLTPGVGNVTYRQLIDACGDPAAVFQSAQHRPELIRKLPRCKSVLIEELRKAADLSAAREALRVAAKVGARPLLLGDSEYPELLTQLRDRPPLLWIKGSFEEADARAVAIVGSRSARDYGLRTARSIATDLALAGVTVVSGGARGVDTEAHEAALLAGGRTIAVLGCGIDVVYPDENEELFQRVALNGAVISDFPPGVEPEGRNFPSRNRIISGLCWATCVVEAGLSSGALITANYALEQGREVFAVPHMVDRANGQGCHRLIKDGAGMVESGADILEALKFSASVPAKHRRSATPIVPPTLSEAQSKIVACLDAEPRHLDQIALDCDMPSNEVLVNLYELEIKSVVRVLPGHLYLSNLEDR